MTPSDIAIILHRLDEMEKMLIEIRDESKKTNGRVNDLELESEHRKGREEAWRIHKMIGMTVASGLLLALIVWFVQSAI